MPRASDPVLARKVAERIVRTLREAGHTAYLAGGCVRDELLGLSPTDYDVATDATPDRIATLFPRTAEVGASFGVVLVHERGVEGSVTVEVATFRSDGPYSDRRRPDSIRFSDPQADARRRDFTINALFLDPFAPEGSRVIDYVGGRADLERRVLRAVGDPDRRLAEDHLRALRAVRLAARLSLTIEPSTAAAIARHARELAGVSRERIGEEIRRMMSHSTRTRAVALLAELGLDAPVLHDVHAPLGDAPCLSSLPPQAPVGACLAAWALDRGLWLEGPEIDALVPRWRAALCLSNDETADLRGVLETLRVLEREWDSSTVAGQKRLATSRWMPFVLAIEGGRDSKRAASIRARIDELASRPPGLAPPPLLDGDDLVRAGFVPGPAFKVILDRVYDAQLEGQVTNREEAMELASTLRV